MRKKTDISKSGNDQESDLEKKKHIDRSVFFSISLNKLNYSFINQI